MRVRRFSSHRQSHTGSVVVSATCATSPLSQITSKTKISKVCELASFWCRVSAGVSYKTKLDEDDDIGDPIPVCRECTLPRANPKSRAYAAIPGGTVIGPVIEVHFVQLLGNHGLDIEIPSPNNPRRVYYTTGTIPAKDRKWKIIPAYSFNSELQNGHKIGAPL